MSLTPQVKIKTMRHHEIQEMTYSVFGISQRIEFAEDHELNKISYKMDK